MVPMVKSSQFIVVFPGVGGADRELRGWWLTRGDQKLVEFLRWIRSVAKKN